ncbi:MAG: ATP-binding protein [Planctomycetales bacterium]|nr:ATP-binding protein [Planctomycetales bacterium]
MADILVVDDSPVDRKLINGLLGKMKDASLRFAETGEHALEMIEEATPDIVLVDLVMPGISGLELVERVRGAHPQVPSILMTSQGNEEIAVQALQKGASSYVPKVQFADELASTVRSVLRQARHARTHHRLIGYLVESTCRFELVTDTSLIPPLIEYLQEMLAQLRLCDETERTRVGVALDEAIVNAVYHGNLELDSDLREHDSAGYHDLAAARAKQPPYVERKLRVHARVCSEQAEFTIRDEGPGFDPGTLPDPTDPTNLENVSGRGILLMRTFMDEVHFDERGNEVTLVKRKSC